MELCQQLRLIFRKDDESIALEELHHFINGKLEKNYTSEQIKIGLDYAGFKSLNDRYFISVKDDAEQSS